MAINSITFNTLKANYPDGKTTPEQIKTKVGGKVNAGWITNTCVIKLSMAFNGTQFAIPNHFPGLLTVSGADKKWYALRVKEFRKYLENKFGKPDLVHKNVRKLSAVPTDFIGKTGIIAFEVAGWSDASGHFTLWNGHRCLDNSDYWGNSHEVVLWEVK